MRAITRAATVSMAQGAVAVALLTACDGGEPVEATRPSARQWEQGEQHDRSAHLRGQAATYLARRANPVEPRSFVVLEQLEHSAKLEAQARTHADAASHDRGRLKGG